MDGNYRSLVISGDPTDKELLYAWSDIQSQYADAIGDAEYKHYVNAFNEITKLNLTLSTIEGIIKVLRLFPHVPLYDELNKLLGDNFKYDYSNQREYQKLLDRAWNRSRRFKISLELKKAAFESIRKKFEGDVKKPTRDYFDRILISLSDFAGYHLTDRITVFEFCERLHRLNRSADVRRKDRRPGQPA